MQFVIFLLILFFSIVIHEFAHGYVAYRLGDDTAYLSGRLTLNPLRHVDPVGTIGVPLLCYVTGLPLFGWAKPVPINPLRLPSPHRDMGKVAAAGPLINLTLALVFALTFKGMLLLQGVVFSPETLQQTFPIFQYGILINVMLAVFNLLPISPLDGGRIVTALLPLHLARGYSRVFERYGMWLVIILILTGAVRYLILPPALFVLDLIGKIF